MQPFCADVRTDVTLAIHSCSDFLRVGCWLWMRVSGFDDFRFLAPPEALVDMWAPCSLQGAVFQFFASCIMWWWAIISFNLWRVVRFRLPLHDVAQHERFYLLLGWGCPIVSSVVLLGLQGYGTEVVRRSLVWPFVCLAIRCLVCEPLLWLDARVGWAQPPELCSVFDCGVPCLSRVRCTVG